jgi:hypothetical protein
MAPFGAPFACAELARPSVPDAQRSAGVDAGIDGAGTRDAVGEDIDGADAPLSGE